MEIQDDMIGTNADEERIKPCLACMAPNAESAETCAECGTSFGMANNLVPTSMIRSEGAMWQKLAPGQKGAKRPTVIKLVGVWIIFLPMFVGSVGLALRQAYERNGFQSLVFVAIFAAWAYLSFIFLFGVTKDFIRLGDANRTD